MTSEISKSIKELFCHVFACKDPSQAVLGRHLTHDPVAVAVDIEDIYYKKPFPLMKIGSGW